VRGAARAAERPPGAVPPIHASDRDAGAIEATAANARRAGVADDVVVARRAVSDVRAPAAHGLVLSNLPFGMRLGGAGDLRDLYARVGHVVARRFAGWDAAFLVADAAPAGRALVAQLAAALGSAPGDALAEVVRLVHGGIPVRLLARRWPAAPSPVDRSAAAGGSAPDGEQRPEGVELLGRDAVPDPGASSLALDQPGGVQHLQVVADGGLAAPEG
jgi:hypothetical protein